MGTQMQSLRSFKDVFTAVLGVLRGHKGRQIKNSPIFWVVEIIEHELWRIVTHRQSEMTPAAELYL